MKAMGIGRRQSGVIRPGAWMTGPRLAGLSLLTTALIGLWQAWRLERWSFDGPGPGLFPLMVAGVFVVLALIVLIWPGRSATTEAGDTDAIDPQTQQRTRAGFAVYAANDNIY